MWRGNGRRSRRRRSCLRSGRDNFVSRLRHRDRCVRDGQHWLDRQLHLVDDEDEYVLDRGAWLARLDLYMPDDMTFLGSENVKRRNGRQVCSDPARSEFAHLGQKSEGIAAVDQRVSGSLKVTRQPPTAAAVPQAQRAPRQMPPALRVRDAR